MVVTKAGRAALVNAAQNGSASVVVSAIGVGSGKYTAADTQTALVSEIKRCDVIEGGQTGDNAIHVAMQDAGSDAYSIYEMGVYLSDGTLFSVYSQTTDPIATKTATSELLLALDAVFADVDVSQITFGDVSYGVAAATEANAGVVALASVEEAQTGTDGKKAVTPKALAAVKASASAAGLVTLASGTEAAAGADDAKAVTPATLKTAIDARAATLAETLRGASDKFVTPEVLKQTTATSGRAGLVELATEEEALTGTDDTHVLTSATAAALFDKLIREWAAAQGE